MGTLAGGEARWRVPARGRAEHHQGDLADGQGTALRHWLQPRNTTKGHVVLRLMILTTAPGRTARGAVYQGRTPKTRGFRLGNVLRGAGSRMFLRVFGQH